jgi:predicted glycosyltransferase
MKILIDAGHPAHVHYFRNAARLLAEKGHDILFTCREKDVITDLLKAYNLPYKSMGKHKKSLAGKITGLVVFDLKLLSAAIKFRPDILLSAGSVYAAHVAWLTGKPHIVLEDSFNMEQVRLYLPFSSAVITGNYPHPDLGAREIRLPAYQEIAYLHPLYFNPDREIYKKLNVKEGEKYFILRFVSWNASHDLGQAGLTLNMKRELIELLKKHGHVFISSEADPGNDLKRYNFPLPAEKMHDALYSAHMFIGEGATMASESAILGTRAVYVNSIERGYVRDQEIRYNLVSNFNNSAGVLEKVGELLHDRDLKIKATRSRLQLLEDNIDLTAFIVWLTDLWPESFRIVKTDPLITDRFRWPETFSK